MDYDDWGVIQTWFNHITKKLCPVSIDRFADGLNAKVDRFNSRFYCLGTEAVDAFTQDWANKVNWLVPPLYLVGRVLEYMKLNHYSGILVVPMWQSAYFWPEVRQMLAQQNSPVRKYVVLGKIFRY